MQVALVQAGTGKIEEELKALSAAYQEKQQAVQVCMSASAPDMNGDTHTHTNVGVDVANSPCEHTRMIQVEVDTNITWPWPHLVDVDVDVNVNVYAGGAAQEGRVPDHGPAGGGADGGARQGL